MTSSTPSPRLCAFTPNSPLSPLQQQRRRPRQRSPLLLLILLALLPALLPALLLALLLAGATGCSSSSQPPGGSETNWLTACVDEEDCRGQSTCHCGICTTACESNKDCKEVPGAATCLQTVVLEDGSCLLEAQTGSELAICVARCDTIEDCPSEADFDCVQGICLAKDGFEARDGALLPVNLIFASDMPDASFDASPEGDAEALDASADVAADALVGMAPDASGDASDANATIVTSLDGSSTSHLLTPWPTCPCTTDMPEGGRAARPGEVAPNAYGGPREPTDSWMTAADEYCGSMLSTGNPLFSIPLEEEGESMACFDSYMCSLGCNTDDDCPDVGVGTAVPRCSTGRSLGDAGSIFKNCYLDCTSGRTCPDGMVCWRGADGAACFWVQERIVPDCPAYCEQKPIPRGCPGWCAAIFVACDTTEGVDCCEGLICSEENYCVQD